MIRNAKATSPSSPQWTRHLLRGTTFLFSTTTNEDFANFAS